MAGAGYWMAASHLSPACRKRRGSGVEGGRADEGMCGAGDLEGLGRKAS